MKIGIIVYSATGHTLSLAVKLKEKLSAAGHVVTLEKLEAEGRADTTVLKTKPAIDIYDALVFGAPVWGLRMPPVMQMYLDQLPALKGKKAVCMVTQLFFRSFGGKQTLEAMKKLCESKGAVVCGSGGVSWTGFNRKQKISDLADRLSGLF